MGIGGSVKKQRNELTRSQHSEFAEAPILENILQNLGTGQNFANKEVHEIIIKNKNISNLTGPVKSDEIIEFKVVGDEHYDIYQAIFDGNAYFRINSGYRLQNVTRNTPKDDRCLLLSTPLNKDETELHFCIVESRERNKVLQTRKFPDGLYISITIVVNKTENKYELTDENENQKVYLHKGDTIELQWNPGDRYYVTEREFCPVSGRFYTVEKVSDDESHSIVPKGKFSKTFNDFGTTFLFRHNKEKHVHDIITCIVNETYPVKHIEIVENKIEPNIIWIDEGDVIEFKWNTKRKETFKQIDPYRINDTKNQSIELTTPGENFFWPYEPTRCGQIYHQFNKLGLFCFKTGSGEIGTIIVQQRKKIIPIPILGDQLTYKIDTNTAIAFKWKLDQSQEEKVWITLDPKSSVVPRVANGVSGVFDCSNHECKHIEAYLLDYFLTCEEFILNIPQHGVYNFSVLNNQQNDLLTIIVENGVDKHRVVYDEENRFEPSTLIVNCMDQVWFDASSQSMGSIYQTDPTGYPMEPEKPLFQPQNNSINYFMKEFMKPGIYYFSTDVTLNAKNPQGQLTDEPLAIIVLPNVKFHYTQVRQNQFESQPIIANINDFVVWEFERIITRNVIQLDSDVTIKDLQSCDNKAVVGRKRQCLAVECLVAGTFFFANPEFEEVTGVEQDRHVATIIVDPPFSRYCFSIRDRGFYPIQLDIEVNETVSWIAEGNQPNHLIAVISADQCDQPRQYSTVNRNIDDYIPDVIHLHTFNKPGDYVIYSNNMQSQAVVAVHTPTEIRAQRKRIQEPRFITPLDIVSRNGTQVKLGSPSTDAQIIYTIDGSLPCQFSNDVAKYEPSLGIILNEPGLHCIRAYAVEIHKIQSSVVTSSLTFITPNEELEALQKRREVFNSIKIGLSSSIEKPNKIYGEIKVTPENALELLDHFELHVNDVAQTTKIPAKDSKFSAQGFAGGEQYEIFVVGHPKPDITECRPIKSNKQAFEIRREVENGGPLISLALSNDPNAIQVIWAHIGDHVSKYNVYVDGVETKVIDEAEFNDFYGLQFHGAQNKRKYLLHIEAQMKGTKELRKSNTLVVIPPLLKLTKEEPNDRCFPRITINDDVGKEEQLVARLEQSSDRLTQKSTEENSSSSPSPRSPAASSRPSIENIQKPEIRPETRKNSSEKHDSTHQTKELKEPKSPKTQIRNVEPEEQSIVSTDRSTNENAYDKNTDISKTNETNVESKSEQHIKPALSNEAKNQAQLLLKKLTEAMENRLKSTNSNYSHTLDTERKHYENGLSNTQRSTTSNGDPITNKRPPKSQRQISKSKTTANTTDNLSDESP